jgi:hypothetical protein
MWCVVKQQVKFEIQHINIYCNHLLFFKVKFTLQKGMKTPRWSKSIAVLFL